MCFENEKILTNRQLQFKYQKAQIQELKKMAIIDKERGIVNAEKLALYGILEFILDELENLPK